VEFAPQRDLQIYSIQIHQKNSPDRGGNFKGELFTLTLTLSPAFAGALRAGRRQGRGNYFKISKSGFGWLDKLDKFIELSNTDSNT
jgi:hypothetical protein